MGLPLCMYRKFVNKNGWEQFRSEEVKAIDELLKDPVYSIDHVIACGGGIIETGMV